MDLGNLHVNDIPSSMSMFLFRSLLHLDFFFLSLLVSATVMHQSLNDAFLLTARILGVGWGKPVTVLVFPQQVHLSGPSLWKGITGGHSLSLSIPSLILATVFSIAQLCAACSSPLSECAI